MRVSPSLDLEAARGIGLWVTGDGSGATLVIRLRQGNSRDYVVPINFTGRRWIEIPTGEAAWRVRDWGWTKSTRKFMDYGSIKSIKIGMGHVPANTTCSVEVEGLTALSEIPEGLVNPTITLGEQTVSVNGTIDCENHFILDENGLFTVYDPHWNALSEQQLAVLLPSDLTTFKMESASSSGNIWLEVGVQASNETTPNPDPTPAFTADPITKANATENAAYSGSIAGDASDPAAGPMTFSKLDGPAWLSVASDGSLSGTPAPGDVGLNAFTVQVDSSGGSDTATLNITVDNDAINDAPVWNSNPVVEAYATEGVAYSSSIADKASDFDAGASLTYAKVSGPAWLSVAADGALSGTPGSSDVGVNGWTVSVSDGIAAPVNAVLHISVVGSYEAEDAVRSDSTLSTFNAGYTGTGYVVMTTAGSSDIEWTVNVPTAASSDLYFRHRTESANTMTLTVNGLVVDSNYTLAGTGGAWGLSSLANVSLHAGSNTIRLTRDSGPNHVRVDHLRLLVAPTTSYLNWLAEEYPGLTETGKTDNPDGDALDNWHEYALGGNPGLADTGFVPIFQKGEDGMEFLHVQRKDAAELNYYLETTTNLVVGTWTNDPYTVTGTNTAFDTHYSEVTNQIPTDLAAQFIRLIVEEE